MSLLAPDQDMIRFGGYASVIVGLCYIVTSLAAAFSPPALQYGTDPHQFWMTMISHSGVHLTWHWSQAIAGIVGLAVVPAVAGLMKGQHKGWAHWVSILAFIGFAVMARGHAMEIAFDKKVMQTYIEAEPTLQQTVHMVAGMGLDKPDGLLTLGGLGLWVLVVSIFAQRANTVSATLAITGIILGVCLVMGLLGHVFLNQMMIYIYFFIGFSILMPIWHLWVGIHLVRQSNS